MSSSAAEEVETTDQDTPLILNGQNIELTPALVQHVNKRIGGTLAKLANGGAVRECDVVLSVNKNPKVEISACQPKPSANEANPFSLALTVHCLLGYLTL